MTLITDGWVAQAERHPDRTALVLHSATQTRISCSYNDLLTAAQQVAMAVTQLQRIESGLPEDRSVCWNWRQNTLLHRSTCVGIWLPNSLECLEVFLGVAMAGGVCLVFDPKWTVAQMQQVLRHYPPDLFVVEDSLYPDEELVIAPIPTVRVTSTESFSGLSPAVTSYHPWRDSYSFDHPNLPAVDATAPFYVGFTSGTTGTPKGVIRQHRSWVASLAASRVEFGMTDADRLLVPGSLVHSLSLYAVLEGLTVGATVHLLSAFSAKTALRCLTMESVTVLVAVPTLLSTIAKTTISRHQSCPDLRLVIAGGSKLEPALRDELPDAFGKAEILEYFGALELSFIALASAREAVPSASVGRPFQGVTLSIRRLDGTGEADRGEVGWIAVKSEFLSAGYLESGESCPATGYRFLDGWATVGDLGWQDAEGFLYVVGREQDMVIRDGINIYPAEIEAVLRSLPEIEEVAVFGLPDGDRGYVLWAAIQWTGVPLGRSDLQSRLQPFLPPAKWPRHYLTVEQFPRTTSGKISRVVLREQVGRESSG